MSNPLVGTYLFFDGRCEEALEFYRKAVNAQVDLMMRFKDSPQPLPPGFVPPGYENKVMHSTFHIGQSILQASDEPQHGAKFGAFSLSLTVSTESEADRAFDALAEGGKVILPLGKTFWSPRFGMLADRFGLRWMVNVVN